MASNSIASFVDGVIQSQLLDANQCVEVHRLKDSVQNARELALELLRRAWLTAFQINQIFQGKGSGLILGPYVLLERIGEGGMGQVFRARQQMLNRIVALKVIRKECLDNPRIIQRFQREIRAAGQLNHPHIIRAYDADRVNGTYYFSMEYIDGVDLSKLVADEGPLRVDRACEYIRHVALGLQHAHERGLVHRDIKPANLLVTRAVPSDRRASSGRWSRPRAHDLKHCSGLLPRIDTKQYPWGIVKILDMGLARCSDPLTGREATHLTHFGSVMGTPDFIAPEQARDSHTSDIRADLYALGCTLYYLLSGQVPFPQGSVTEKLILHQRDEPESVLAVRSRKMLDLKDPSGASKTTQADIQVPAAVGKVLRRLMAKRPEDRYQMPIEVANELGEILKQMAEGTLPPDLASERTTELVVGALPAGSQPATSLGAKGQPLRPAQIQLGSARRRRPRRRLSIYVAMATSLAAVVILTMIAVLMSRASPMQAAPVVETPEAPAKLNDVDESMWKAVLKKGIDKRAPWEEVRQELLKQRALAGNGAQTVKLDDLLTRLPMPLDGLDRSRPGAFVPKGLPAEVVGIYGMVKPLAMKPVASVALSPDGRWLIASEDSNVRLFDLQNASAPTRLPAHTERITQVTFSPDGRFLVSSSEDGAVRVWDVATRKRLVAFEEHKKPVTHFAVHPESSLIASAGKDGFIRLWNPNTAAEVRKVPSQTSEVMALTFTPDGKFIFWAGYGKEIRWCDVKDGVTSKFDSRFPANRALAFQPDGNLVVHGGMQGALAVAAWDGKILVEKGTLQEQAQVHQVAFAPGGKAFASVGVDPPAVIFDAQTLKVRKSYPTMRSAGFSTAFSPEGRHFVVGGASSQIIVVRLASQDLDALKKAIE